MEGLYYLCSENKGADQLRGYREADLRLCFRMCKKRFSHDAAHIMLPLFINRSKINELNVENTRLNKEIETGNEENASFLTYEKRAETLASSIKDLQGELGDYNILVDKLTTDEDIADVELDLNDVSIKDFIWGAS